MNKKVKITLAIILASALASSLLTTGCRTNPTIQWTPVPTLTTTPAATPTVTPTPTIQIPEGTQIGNRAPDFRLTNLDGQSVSLSDFRGRPVLINFWATWCPPCRFEMPFIQEIFEDKEWSDTGLKILAVDIGENPSTVKEFMESNGLTFTALLDISQDVALEYNVRAIPTTYLIDKDGIIKDLKIGAFSGKAEIEMRLLKITR